MNLCGLFCMLAFVTIKAGSTEHSNRGLKLHSSIIEDAFTRNTTEKDDEQLEDVALLKKQKAVENRKPTKAATDKKLPQASTDKLKREDTEFDSKTKDDATAESKNKKEKDKDSPSLAPKKKETKGCRRLSTGDITEMKKPKGYKKIQHKGNSSSSNKGSDKLEKSDEEDDDEEDDDDDDVGAYSPGSGHIDKNHSKAEKVHIDDFDPKKHKTEKYSDDNYDCDMGTDPPELSRAPSPGIPASEEDISISLSPYFVLYEIQQTRIPLLTEYDELTTFTSGYLDNYLRSVFVDMTEIAYVGSRTTLLGSEFRLAQPVRIDYATNVTFTSISLIPGTSELEKIAQGAFEGANGVSYAAAIAAGVGPNNIFSTTSSVSYALTESITSLLRSSTRVESAIYAINGALIAFVVLLYRWRSKNQSSITTGGKSLMDSHDVDDEQHMRNIIEGWNAGLVPVLSSMKVPITSIRKKKKSRGKYKTVDGEIKGAETSSM